MVIPFKYILVKRTFIIGLGKATVDRLIKSGAKGVVAFDRNIETKFDSQNVLPFQGSVISEEDVTKALEQCQKQFGRLDAVVNCAGNY